MNRFVLRLLFRSYSDRPKLVAPLKNSLIGETSVAGSVAPASSTPNFSNRVATIYQPARSAMQSGLLHNGEWRIDFDRTQSRWENPLMGWTSSRDAMQAVAIKFDTKEEAIRFAERQGWRYEVREGNQFNWKKKSYAENFLYSSERLKFVRTK